MACAAHIFAAHVRAGPGPIWAALTEPGQTAAYLYGLAAHSTWAPGAPIVFRVADRVGPSAASCTHDPMNGCPTCCKPARATRRRA